MGSSSIVYSGVRVPGEEALAIKKLKVVSEISGLDQSKLYTIRDEIQRYKRLKHEHIVEYYGCEMLD